MFTKKQFLIYTLKLSVIIYLVKSITGGILLYRGVTPTYQGWVVSFICAIAYDVYYFRKEKRNNESEM